MVNVASACSGPAPFGGPDLPEHLAHSEALWLGTFA
jgi:hypothetical protein